jgi:hypothetical protein
MASVAPKFPKIVDSLNFHASILWRPVVMWDFATNSAGPRRSRNRCPVQGMWGQRIKTEDHVWLVTIMLRLVSKLLGLLLGKCVVC